MTFIKGTKPNGNITTFSKGANKTAKSVYDPATDKFKSIVFDNKTGEVLFKGQGKLGGPKFGKKV